MVHTYGEHVSNVYIASFLSGMKLVGKASSLKSHKGQTMSKLMPKGAGAIVSFGLKEAKKSAIKFIESLKFFLI